MSKLSVLVLTFICTGCSLTDAIKLEQKYLWQELDYDWPSAAIKEEAIQSGRYKAEHNLPLGLDIWHDKLFITVPRYCIDKAVMIPKSLTRLGLRGRVNYLNVWNAKHSNSSYKPIACQTRTRNAKARLSILDLNKTKKKYLVVQHAKPLCDWL